MVSAARLLAFVATLYAGLSRPEQVCTAGSAYSADTNDAYEVTLKWLDSVMPVGQSDNFLHRPKTPHNDSAAILSRQTQSQPLRKHCHDPTGGHKSSPESSQRDVKDPMQFQHMTPKSIVSPENGAKVRGQNDSVHKYLE